MNHEYATEDVMTQKQIEDYLDAIFADLTQWDFRDSLLNISYDYQPHVRDCLVELYAKTVEDINALIHAVRIADSTQILSRKSFLGRFSDQS